MKREINDWVNVKNQKPQEGAAVKVKIDEGGQVRNEATLIYKNNLWWLPDMSMYVYFTPTHWKEK